MKTFKYFFEAIFIYLFFLISLILGIFLSRKIFSFLFKKVGPLIRSNKKVFENLNNFSSKLSEDMKREIAAEMWANYGKTFIEYIFLYKFRKNNSHIEISGLDHLEKILKKNKPLIFISGHFANFELMSMEITKKNIKLATIYRPLNNFFLNPLMEYLRKKYVCSNQIKKGRSGVKDSIFFLKKGYSVALMIDQRVSEGEKIKFFNKDALTTTLPAQLANKFDIDIVPVYLERKSSELFYMEFYKPILASEYKDKMKITFKLNQILEDMVKRNPKQWIWTHDRWK
tara:strand:- start:33 stop:887 length:855 start_codon:yes stop_codon:yes gene_type:complete